MSDQAGFLPGARLWTPWRMAYVGGGTAKAGCVFCDALAGSDDVATLIVHRGEHAFVMLNLFPYNTGHLMVIPNEHASDLAEIPTAARAEMAELTASFATGLRQVMRCDGLNTGMNLGSAAGAGIADHLHQHLVPRWVGDANFMPIVGGTKVLPELIPATYATIRAEVARQRSGQQYVRAILLADDRRSLLLDGDALPQVTVPAASTPWDALRAALVPSVTSCELLAWGGPASTGDDVMAAPVLVTAIAPQAGASMPWRRVDLDVVSSTLAPEDALTVTTALHRLD